MLAARIRGLGDWVQGVCVRALQVILVVGVLVGRALRVIVGRVGGGMQRRLRRDAVRRAFAVVGRVENCGR